MAQSPGSPPRSAWQVDPSEIAACRRYGCLDMVTHMKTTIEIADTLLIEARQAAARDQTTLRALVEEGLRQVVQERKRTPRFRLREASFRGKGLRPEISEGDWETIRTMAYEGRGE